MVKPSVIVAWPAHVEYPIFRYNLERFKKYFNKVYIAITQITMPEPHYTSWLITTIGGVQLVKPPNKYSDWRDNAVRDILDNFIHEGYVLFLEQDFLIKDERFFEIALSTDKDIVYYDEGGRIHPAFALVKRELIEKTSKDFSVHPEIDHFGYFFKELMPLGTSVELKELGLKEQEDFVHLAGVTHNYYNYLHNQPLYKEHEWLAYNYLSQSLPVKQDPKWLAFLKEIEAKHGRGDYKGWISNFFPEVEENG